MYDSIEGLGRPSSVSFNTDGDLLVVDQGTRKVTNHGENEQPPVRRGGRGWQQVDIASPFLSLRLVLEEMGEKLEGNGGVSVTVVQAFGSLEVHVLFPGTKRKPAGNVQ